MIEEPYYVRGLTQSTIVERIAQERPYSLTQQQISKDIKAILKQKVKDLGQPTMDWIVLQLAKLDALEREYWQAWEVRKGDGRSGDIRYLDGIGKVVKQRMQILGFDAQTIIHQHVSKEEKVEEVYDLGDGVIIRFPEFNRHSFLPK